MDTFENNENIEPQRGMYPIDCWAPAPEIPNQDRIFAAAAELQAAHERGEDWAVNEPLSQQMVILTLTAVEDGLRAIMDKWQHGSRQQPFPDMLDSIDEIMRIVSKEGKEEQERVKQAAEDKSRDA